MKEEKIVKSFKINIRNEPNGTKLQTRDKLDKTGEK